MLRAVYIRTLKDGVTDDRYVDAWMPEGTAIQDYPARVTISHSSVDERQTVTVIEFDGDPEHLLDSLGALVRPDWRDRVAEVVESTEVETVFVESLSFGATGTPAST